MSNYSSTFCVPYSCVLFFASILPSKDEFLRLLDPDLLLCFTFLSPFLSDFPSQFADGCLLYTHGIDPSFFKKKLKQRFGLVFSIDSEEGFTSSTYTSHVEKCPRA